MPELHLDAKRAGDVFAGGDEPDTEDTKPRSRAKTGEKAAQSPPKSRSGGSRRGAGLEGKLRKALERIADVLDARGDDELAPAIREDAAAMAAGLASIARRFSPARLVLVLVLEVVEPLLAFGRVAGILRRRFLEWRAGRVEEAAALAAEYEAELARQAAAAGDPLAAVAMP